MISSRHITPVVGIVLALLLLGSASSYCRQSEAPPDSEAAVSDSLFVDTVIIVGNEHTKDFVILREMTLHPGMLITPERLEYDKSRIYSLGLFNSIGIKPVQSSSPHMATLLVTVTERWYIFPYPILGLKDRDWSKIFFGLGFIHTNFRGRNEKLYTSGIVGYDPAFAITYRNPFLTPEGNYFAQVQTGYSLVRNRSIIAQQGLAQNFDERHYSAYLSLGRRIGIAQTVSLSGGFEMVDTRDRRPPTTIAPDGRDTYPVLSLSYVYDSRDLLEYASLGTLARVTATKYGFPGKPLDFIRYNLDLRRYLPVAGPVTIQGRAFTDLIAGGPTPTYNHDYFGYNERIRGHFFEVMEGESMAGASVELHIPLFLPRYFAVDFLPKQFSVWRFGIVAALFADAGTVWYRGQAVSLANAPRGYGGGIHFLLPYGGVVRLEYALNESRHGEFIADVGAAF